MSSLQQQQQQKEALPLLLFSDEITAELFSFLGAHDTARLAKTCRHVRRVSHMSRALWRRFCYDDYGVSQGHPAANWLEVYDYLKGQEKTYHDTPNVFFLPTQVLFSDDGSEQDGNPASNALQPAFRHDYARCWCTNAYIDHDVDLVATLQEQQQQQNNNNQQQTPCLVMAFEIVNGNRNFSAPVKEALCFASMDMPDLEQAKDFDVAKGGIEWAVKLQERQEEELREQERQLLQWRNTTTTTTTTTTTNHDQDPGFAWPRPTTPSKHKPNDPLAGFSFPGIPMAFNKRLKHPVTRPTVARFVHFKLLSSSKCNHRVSNNIDVSGLYTYGVPLPQLQNLVFPPELIANDDETSNAVMPPPDPSRYQRRYDVKPYPWEIHEEFHHQQLVRDDREDFNRVAEMFGFNRAHIDLSRRMIREWQDDNDSSSSSEVDDDHNDDGSEH